MSVAVVSFATNPGMILLTEHLAAVSDVIGGSACSRYFLFAGKFGFNVPSFGPAAARCVLQQQSTLFCSCVCLQYITEAEKV